MASNVIPKTLLGLPLIPKHATLKSPPLGLPINSLRRLSLSLGPTHFGPITTVKSPFVVRAEAEDSPPDEAVEEAVAAVEPEAEGEGEGGVAVATEPRPPRKARLKFGEVIRVLNNRAVAAMDESRPIPDVRVGDILELRVFIEGKRRLALYKGIVISRQNAGVHTTITIRRFYSGCGVEIVIPLYSPNIREITVVDKRKVRKAKLYYLRDKLPRFSIIKEKKKK